MRLRFLALAIVLLVPSASAVEGVHLSTRGDERVVAFTSAAPLGNANVSWSGPSGTGVARADRWPSPNADDDAAYAARIPADATTYAINGRVFHPRPPPAPGAPTRVAFVADWGGSTDSWAVYDAIVAAKPDLVVIGGDISYANGVPGKWDEWLAHVEPLLSTVPVMTAFGNHEALCVDAQQRMKECDHEITEYAEHFHMPRAPDRYYSFDWGPARFVALDTEAYHSGLAKATDDTVQEAFLHDALAATPSGDWKIAYYHRSLYTSNTGQDEPDATARAALEPIFAAGGLDLALSGHVHAYERSHPINGTVYVDSGGGGRSLYSSWGPQPGWSASRSAEYEFVLLDISKEKLDVRALRPDGSTLDRFTITEHGSVQEASGGSIFARFVPGAPLVAVVATLALLAVGRRVPR